MMRLLVVLAVLAIAYAILGGGADKEGKPLKPEEQYRQQEQNVEQMEQQLQEQTRKQFEALDKQQEPPAE